jgi:hypothetical protein
MKKTRQPGGGPRRKPGSLKKPPRPRGGLQAFVGMFASRTGDLVVRHDDYLYTWKKPTS